MEVIIFIGIQGSGKSTFYRERFIDSHMRINLDMLKTRHREQLLVRACLEAKQPFVVDNTNPTLADRQRYIPSAQAKQFKVVGYYFDVDLELCKYRNNQRSRKRQVPLIGLLSTARKLVKPTWDEGFDQIYHVYSQPPIHQPMNSVMGTLKGQNKSISRQKLSMNRPHIPKPETRERLLKNLRQTRL
jgi:predicted kinase